MQLSQDQEKAIKLGRKWFGDNLWMMFFLAGPAGSGKTSIAKLIAQDAKNPQFCAYTGRAALQLTKKGCPAKTLHQLLYQPYTIDGKVQFVPREWNEKHPLWNCDLIVIDEVSFVPLEQADLLIRTNKPILMLGDPYQLPPPTGNGAMIADQKPDYLLTEIHRQAQDNPVLRLATRIREGRGLDPKFILKSRQHVQDALRYLELFKKRAPEGSSHMLLAGKRDTVAQVNAESRKQSDLLIEVGEPLLCLRNNHELGTMNGSIWINQEPLSDDLEYDEEHQVIYAPFGQLESTDFADTVLPAVPLDLSAMLGISKDSGWRFEVQEDRSINPVEFDYGYGRTVHKAQGDEAYSGIIIDESWCFREHRNRWLYTAVTRFTDEVKIISYK